MSIFDLPWPIFQRDLCSHLFPASSPSSSTYKAANVRSQQTYIDHAGVECDVRTGLPIGSHQNKPTGNGYDDWEQNAGKQKSGGGYGFFDAGGSEEVAKKERSDRNKFSGVGRTLLHTEYA